ncbi:hypothetical protein A3Q56_02682 [Intoshia linei]|uniref:Arrestin-like N-terminal domain-containing protein n=1 Tax=Intoshia linei TaxID=1819745 RepID=A0A177B7G2_9BILA|nr:hypothetical protein A3Q56_02682 [Intoshia linei]
MLSFLKSSTIKKVDVGIAKTIFMAGETINGTINIECSESTLLEKVSVKIHGVVLVKIREGNNNNKNTYKQTFYATETNLQQYTTQLNVGINTMTFSVALIDQENSPLTTSLKIGDGKIYYKLKIDINGDQKYKTYIDIIASYPETIDVSSFPGKAEDDKKRCCQTGPLVISASIDNTLIKLGQPCTLSYNIENKNNSKYKMILKLQRKIKLNAHHNVLRRTLTLYTQPLGTVNPWGSMNNRQVLSLDPSVLPTYPKVENFVEVYDYFKGKKVYVLIQASD